MSTHLSPPSLPSTARKLVDLLSSVAGSAEEYDVGLAHVWELLKDDDDGDDHFWKYSPAFIDCYFNLVLSFSWRPGREWGRVLWYFICRKDIKTTRLFRTFPGET